MGLVVWVGGGQSDLERGVCLPVSLTIADGGETKHTDKILLLGCET